MERYISGERMIYVAMRRGRMSLTSNGQHISNPQYRSTRLNPDGRLFVTNTRPVS